jgi:hypothetical protein
MATSRSIAKMEDLTEISSRITIAELDVTNTSAIRKVFGATGPLDILVNCAGWVHMVRSSTATRKPGREPWTRTRLRPSARSRRHCRRWSSVAVGRSSTVASVASSMTGVANRAAYGASKAAKIGLTKAVARDAIATGVRCNAPLPRHDALPSLQEPHRRQRRPLRKCTGPSSPVSRWADGNSGGDGGGRGLPRERRNSIHDRPASGPSMEARHYELACQNVRERCRPCFHRGDRRLLPEGVCRDRRRRSHGGRCHRP